MADLRQLMITEQQPVPAAKETKETDIAMLEEYIHSLEVENPSKPFGMGSERVLPIGSVVF